MAENEQKMYDDIRIDGGINEFFARGGFGFSKLKPIQCTGVSATKSYRGDEAEDLQVFDGDIYHLGDLNIKYVVTWHDTGFMGKQIRSSSYVGLNYWKDRMQIIGNKYEHPELLAN